MPHAALAYFLWGLFPLYFKALQDVPAHQILAHRIVWSLVLVMAVLACRRQWGWVHRAVASRRVLGLFALSAAMVSANWLTYIWAITSGHVVEASLGYFITPLVNVCIGALVLHERLRRAQWLAVALAAAGVAWLTWHAGRLPWIGLVLAASFGAYALLRKTAPLGPLEGLALETSLLAPLALAAMAWWIGQGSDAFTVAAPATQALLVLAGPITAVPLLLFAAGARRIPMSTLGLLQYISPTLQLLLGVWLYGEAFDSGRLGGYLAIWAALALYSAELWLRGRSTASA